MRLRETFCRSLSFAQGVVELCEFQGEGSILQEVGIGYCPNQWPSVLGVVFNRLYRFLISSLSNCCYVGRCPKYKGSTKEVLEGCYGYVCIYEDILYLMIRFPSYGN